MKPCFEELVALARKHFERKGYRVHSGLQFGCELVLYADDPDNVHSDFCVHVVSESRINWMQLQGLARSMSTLHKQLIIVDVLPCSREEPCSISYTYLKDEHHDDNAGDQGRGGDGSEETRNCTEMYFKIDEMAIASGHAPFRHKKGATKIGGQVKKKGRKN